MSRTIAQYEKGTGMESSRVKIPGLIPNSQNTHYYRNLGETVRIKAGTLIIHSGDVPQYCYFIRRGRVFAGMIDKTYGERILFSLEKDTIFLAQYLLTGSCSSMFFEANTDVVAQKITYPELVQGMKSRFSVTLDIIYGMNRFNETILMRISDDLNEAASVKICNLFIDMADLHGEQTDIGILVNVKIKQEVVGKLTGLHRVTVVRELNKLKEKKLLISQDGRYLIPDREKLIQYRDNKGVPEKESRL